MTILRAGDDVLESSFINQSERDPTPANDADRVPRLESNGQLHRDFLPVKFGGDGSDGALTVSSGNTNIDLGGAAFFIKNYSSISITGTGSVTFTNPNSNGTTIIIRCSGNVTLTSSATPMLDASGCGGTNGAGGSGNNQFDSHAGSGGSNGVGLQLTCTGGAANAGTAGAKPTAFNFSATLVDYQLLKELYKYISPGSGGAGGTALIGSNVSSRTSTAADGGKGGGALVIECAGSFNFTTGSISVAGKNGSNGVAPSPAPADYNNGGGGGGGGGSLLILYNVLTANTGTVTVSGGTGGNSFGTYSTGTGGSGGASTITNGSTGTSATSGNKSGGDGGVGNYKIMSNYLFV